MDTGFHPEQPHVGDTVAFMIEEYKKSIAPMERLFGASEEIRQRKCNKQDAKKVPKKSENTVHDENQSNNISLNADGQPVKEVKLEKSAFLHEQVVDVMSENDSAPNDINTKSSEEKKHQRDHST